MNGSQTRTYDRPRFSPPDPKAVASARAAKIEDPADRATFLDAFTQGRVAELRDDPRRYGWYRQALEADDSFRVAGLIEGMTSVPAPGRKWMPWKR